MTEPSRGWIWSKNKSIAEPSHSFAKDLSIQGHALELRVYAEDVAGFLPSTGTLTHYRPPMGSGVPWTTAWKRAAK